MSAGAVEPGVKASRSERRRSETRRRLLTAAGELFAEKGVGDTRIVEITERADVAAGSFYNHFEDKEAIVSATLAEIAEAHGAEVDRLTAEFDDPAEVVAFAHVHFVRLAIDDRSLGRLLVRLDASHRLLRNALGPLATRDIVAGIEAGRFRVEDPVSAVYATGGALLGTISGVVDEDLGDGAELIHAAAVLRMLGLGPDEAGRVAARVSR